jgi:hypothetical protein
MSGWTEDRIEKLKGLWAQGMSAKDIALSLGGVTRNAVIGKIHGLGLPNQRRTFLQPLTADDRGPEEGVLDFRQRALTQDVRIALAQATSLQEVKDVLDGLIATGTLKLHFPMGG